METDKVKRCPKCGAYCFSASHSQDACARLEKLHTEIESLLRPRRALKRG